MRETTLCYITRGDQVLMLHRTGKEHDANQGKWLGVGGGLEAGETPETCLLREVLEETGLVLTRYQARGIVHFRSDTWEDEEMYLYTADDFTGEMIECDEGALHWIDREQILQLELWEGDRIFLALLAKGAPWFELTLNYEGEALTRAVLDGQTIALPR